MCVCIYLYVRSFLFAGSKESDFLLPASPLFLLLLFFIRSYIPTQSAAAEQNDKKVFFLLPAEFTAV